MSITSLQETSLNSWQAKYHGNYGIYTIKIKTDGNKTIDFSCSCPSDYYPCKHIPMVEKAIKERITKNLKNDNKQEITFEQFLENVSYSELYDFIVKQAQYNPQLKNAVLMEFAHKINQKNSQSVNNYTQLLRNALDGLYFDYEDIEYNYGYDVIEIDILDQWFDKAQEFINQGNPNEAILICKACIEEYASWYEESDCDVLDYIDSSYKDTPFYILEKALSMQGVDSKEQFDYCKSEMLKPKYKRTEMYDGFNDLFMNLSAKVGSNDFIILQDNLLKDISDRSSYEAKVILQQKIDFYRNSKQPDKAYEVIKENLQIESFRKEWTEKLIAENKLQEAKMLINEYILKNEKEGNYLHSWFDLKLQIAQKESDIKEVQHISFKFIESGFSTQYYNIYKSTFTKEEWTEKAEKLIQHYEKNHRTNWINSSKAEVLQAEKQEERLLQYIEKYLTLDNLDRYYLAFSASFPERTLALFKKTINQYAQNTGREIYERIVSLFKKMIQIKGGQEVVKEMINQYRILYKNRKAMMEIIKQNESKL